MMIEIFQAGFDKLTPYNEFIDSQRNFVRLKRIGP